MIHSQFQPVHTHGWKPETMQPTVLLALASVLLATLLEILAQKSTADSALCLVNAAADILDLDVKRMQLQLSRPEGATGTGSLFFGLSGEPL